MINKKAARRKKRAKEKQDMTAVIENTAVEELEFGNPNQDARQETAGKVFTLLIDLLEVRNILKATEKEVEKLKARKKVLEIDAFDKMTTIEMDSMVVKGKTCYRKSFTKFFMASGVLKPLAIDWVRTTLTADAVTEEVGWQRLQPLMNAYMEDSGAELPTTEDGVKLIKSEPAQIIGVRKKQ